MKDERPLTLHTKFLIKELSATLDLIKEELDGEVEEQMNALIKKWKEIRE